MSYDNTTPDAEADIITDEQPDPRDEIIARLNAALEEAIAELDLELAA